MHESRYNVWIVDGDDHVVHAGLSGAVVRLTRAQRQAVDDFLGGAAVDAVHSDVLEELVRARVLVSSQVDELEVLRSRYRRGIDDPGLLGLTVVTSLGCNFDCPYCFEDKHPSILRPAVADAVTRLVARRAGDLRTLGISWYGGEPLLGGGALFALSTRLRGICAREEVEYKASIYTNGWLLDRPTAVRLAEHQVGDALVSIDGPPAVHDALRPHVNGQGTFDRILANVCAVADVLDVTVRVNLDAHNLDRVEELVALLAGAGLAGRVGLSPGHLVANHFNPAAPSATYARRCLTPGEFADTELAFNRIARDHGFAAGSLPSPVTSPCTAVRANEWIVGPEGQLWKCFDDVGFDDEVVGSIFAIDAPNGRLAKWLAHDPFSDPECSTCIALPGCMGGCSLYGRDPVLHDNRCSTFRRRHVEALADAIGAARPGTATLAELAVAGGTPVALGPTRRRVSA